MNYLIGLLFCLMFSVHSYSQIIINKTFKPTTRPLTLTGKSGGTTAYVAVLYYNNEVLDICPASFGDFKITDDSTKGFMIGGSFFFHKSKLKPEHIIDYAGSDQSIRTNMSLFPSGYFSVSHRVDEERATPLPPYFRVAFETITLDLGSVSDPITDQLPAYIRRLFKPTELRPSPTGANFFFGLLRYNGKQIIAFSPIGSLTATSTTLHFDFWFDKDKLKPEQDVELLTKYAFSMYNKQIIGRSNIHQNVPYVPSTPAYLSIHPEYIRLK